MFCTTCGSRMAEDANFCGVCGTRILRAAAPPPAPSPAPAPAVPAQAAPTASAKCRWCYSVVDAAQASCPRCGATLQVEGVVARSGWGQLPGRKDMAKLQFGNSFCQIEGAYVPVADMKLAPEDSVYFTHHVLLWKDPAVNVTTLPLKGAWKRLFAGMPLIMTQAQGPGHIAFSKDDPGELIPVPLQPGQTLDVREHLFLAATSNVAYDWFQTGIWFKTKSDDETETHYPVGMFMDRFTAPQTPGLLLLHAGGNVFVRELAPQQTILVKPSALIFKDPAVQMHLHFEHPNTGWRGWGYWSNRYMWLRLSGPGRVAVQSVFESIEGESRNISGYSYATEQRWVSEPSRKFRFPAK
jgi:uncharacterized protein (AIM24 family)/RNA polymerase subunit RPABC4/transcription elongation factor Spt4